ncbi:MAG: hypothetical protein KKB21_05590 [Nanoarchaeota archaeon]|nr:hypothetical protein [Nanoarchaeota archaeon]
MSNNKFTITKKIAKPGSQAVIIVPTLLQDKLCPGTLAEITIEILKE